jgi:hypothetical protein
MDKEDSMKALETVNAWIENCDTKSSIILGFYGVFITLFLSTEEIINLKNILIKLGNESTCLAVSYCILLLIAIITFFYGMFRLVGVLIPIIDEKRPSLMFFGAVSKYKCFDEYYEAVKKQSEEKLFEDISGQLYAASKICSQKFYNQKLGLKISAIGLVGFTVLIFVSRFIL